VVPLLLRPNRAAEVLDISQSTLKRLVREGRLPVVRVNGCTRVRLSDLEAFVDRLAEAVADPDNEPEPAARAS
jgi:excisionase family DNA binding protein